VWQVGLVALLGVAMASEDAARTKAVADAKALLVRELGVKEVEVAVRKVTATDWPDAALGCPEKDKAYAQVITPGFRVLLDVKGKVYPVHTGHGRAVRCDSLRKGPKVPDKTTQE
jgi:hypothetical protein